MIDSVSGSTRFRRRQNRARIRDGKLDAFVTNRSQTFNILEERVMWETRPVNLQLRLPQDIVEQLEEIQRTDPEFMSRLVLYGLTRRSIFHELRDRPASSDSISETRSLTM